MSPQKAFEYLGTVGVTTLLMAYLMRWHLNFSKIGYLYIFILPALLAVLLVALSLHHYFRIFTVGTRARRSWGAFGLSVISILAAVSLYPVVSRALWVPYAYGPGP